MAEFDMPKYTPTDDEVVESTCAAYQWNWENADRFPDFWDHLRFWFHGAGIAMYGCGREAAREDFFFLRDHCAFREAELRLKKYEADCAKP